MRRLFLALALAILHAGSASAADGSPLSNDDPAFVIAGLGAMGDRAATEDTSAAFALGYRVGPALEFLHIRPSLDLLVTNQGTVYGWLGLGLDLFLGSRFVFTPQIGVGGYSAGGGQSLGHVILFRTGGTLSLRFDNRARVGIGVHHLSNLGLGHRNPGVETVGLYFALPFHR